MENFEDKVFNYEDLNTTTSTSTYSTTTTSTTKPIRFNYDKPPGWNKKRPSKISRFFSIMYKGFTGKEMEPSEIRRYDIWLLDIKAGAFALAIGLGLWIAATTSTIGSEKYNENKDPTYLDRVIEYFYPEDNETEVEQKPTPKQVVVVKDSLVNIDSLLYISDSLIRANGGYTDTIVR